MFFHISQVITFSTTTPAAKVNSADKQRRTWIFFCLHGTIASYLLWKQTRWPPFVPACHARLDFDESDTSVFVLSSLSFPSTSFSLVWNKMNNIRGSLFVKKGVGFAFAEVSQSHRLWSRIMKIRIHWKWHYNCCFPKKRKKSFLADSKFKFGFEASWLLGWWNCFTSAMVSMFIWFYTNTGANQDSGLFVQWWLIQLQFECCVLLPLSLFNTAEPTDSPTAMTAFTVGSMKRQSAESR